MSEHRGQIIWAFLCTCDDCRRKRRAALNALPEKATGMSWKINADLVFPRFMNPSDYDAGATVYDWFENHAPQLDEVYASENEANAAVDELRCHYRGKDVHGVSCRLTVVATED